MLWIKGKPAATHSLAKALLAAHSPEQIRWVSGLGHARALLGQSHAAVVIDTHAGLDPDALGAASGSIMGGGLCIVLTPSGQSGTESAFSQRFIRMLAAAAITEHWHADTHMPAPQPIPPLRFAQTPSECVPNPEQSQVIQAIQTLVQAPQTTPQPVYLITADRGRGKSAALGMALRELNSANARVTGPAQAAIATLKTHAGEVPVKFQAPETIEPSAELLIIDEAAALPLGQIEHLVANNPRCVLAGTVHGYEGSGRGLLLRLAEQLNQPQRPVNTLRLHAPIRWPANDPLEAFIHRLLLLDVEPLPLRAPKPAAATFLINSLPRATLATDESTLRDTFGLLVRGHYQTRPRDLQQLMDEPELMRWVARFDGQIKGVLIARVEGGFAPALTQAIYAGQRRPFGHLIAQSLTFHAGIADAARYQGLRIQRIAVHPQYQRQGIGRQLVEQAQAWALEQGLDWWGVSFGSHPDVIDFWSQTGLLPVRLGNRTDPRSAAPAVIMLQDLSPAGQKLMAEARSRFSVHWHDQLPWRGQHLAQAVRERLERSVVPAESQPIDRADGQAFAYGQRALLDSIGALQRLARRAPIVERLSAAEQRLLQQALQTPWDSAALGRVPGYTGRRHALGALRELTAVLLEANYE